MNTVDRHARQRMGCGFEPPPAPSVVVQAWEHVGREVGKDEPEVCPGYACALPEVLETSRARLHWGKGSLPVFTHGEPTEELVAAIEVLDGEAAQADHWAIKNASKKDC